jgi:hypothetical protein
VTSDLVGLIECGSDIGFFTDIYPEDKQFILRIFGREVGENFWFAEGGNHNFSIL